MTLAVRRITPISRLTVRLLTLRKILAATDLGPSSDAALDSGHRLASLAGAVLHVVHVLEPATAGGDAAAAEMLRGTIQRAGIPDRDARMHMIPGLPADTIGSLADRIEADVVVMGQHGHAAGGGDDVRLGSTARAVAEHASVPCLVAGQPLRLPLERVLVPIDLSDIARGALLVGMSWASALRSRGGGAALDALHVEAGVADGAPGPGTAAVADELRIVAVRAGDWTGVAVQGMTERGADVAAVIAHHALASDADLVVLGTRGLGSRGDTGLGSVSVSVMARLQLPILLVPPSVWRMHGESG